MKPLAQHPTVQNLANLPPAPRRTGPVSAFWLRQVVLDCGADDVGFVSLSRSEIDGQRAEIKRLFPAARTLVSFAIRMNRENIRTPARSVANLEFHHTTGEVNEVGRRVVRKIAEHGIQALNLASGFPMEADRWGEKMWIISHKPVAVAAGLGQMGIHRNVIHPRFGSFILLGTVLLDAEVDEESRPVTFNPCLECKLCVAACPTGAISPDGHFNFAACYTHNYREFMGGFVDWVETIAGSKDAPDYRRSVSDAETVSIWQSLAFGPNYKAAYCLAVCPAGEEVISPFLENRKQFLDGIVRPLQAKQETVYVVSGSDAEEHVQRRFPHKTTKRVKNGLRVRSVAGFLRGLPVTFERGRSAGLNAIFHFTFTGKENVKATVEIREQRLTVTSGHIGRAGFSVIADSATWIGFLSREKNLFWALLTRSIRVKGPLRLFRAFARCFPS